MRSILAGIILTILGGQLGQKEGGGPATAASRPLRSAAGELLNVAVPNGWSLFDPAQRAALDDINRQWREADQQVAKAPGPDMAAQAVTRRQQVEERLVKLVGACKNLVDVTIESGRATVAGTGSVAVPGDAGVLLFRIRGRPGEMHVVTADYDLGRSREPIPVSVSADGDTWAVVRLSNVPAGANSLVVQLTLPGGRVVPLIVSVRAPEPARVRVRILSEATGQPIPAMVKLAWKVDGQDRRPSNAMDFLPQFEGLGRPAPGRFATLPGRLNGHSWWCVPGPFDMPVPPGEWEIIIRHGLEHVPIFEQFTTQPGQRLELTYKLRRWVDMPHLGWYSGDAHVHARMVSDDDARHLMTWAQAEDVRAVSILKMSDVYRTWFQQRGFGPPSRVVDNGYVLVPGQECPRTHSDGFGHTISLNTPAYVRDIDRYWLYDEVADEVHRQGGLFGFAHTYLVHPYIRRGSSLIAPRPRIDFAEILQVARMGTDFYYDWLNLGYKIAVSAGTDVPWQGSIGEVRMYAFVGDQPFSADAWFEAVKRGRTFVTNGPMLDLHVDDAMPGDQIAAPQPRRLRVRCRAWGCRDYVVPTRLEIVQHGKVVKMVESADTTVDEISVDFEVDSGYGFWLAARATGSDGSLAHTTPVYVVRDPLRFWNMDAVDDLISQRLANLDDIEQLVARARQAVEQGKADDNMTARTMAQQAPELLRRVAEARVFFGELKKTAERERSLRFRRVDPRLRMWIDREYDQHATPVPLSEPLTFVLSWSNPVPAVREETTMCRTLLFAAPRSVIFRDLPLPSLGADEVLIRTMYTGISRGTEMTVYRGTSPFYDKHYDPVTRLFTRGGEPSLRYPIEFGYENVGRIVDMGPGVKGFSAGDVVFTPTQHSEFIVMNTTQAGPFFGSLVPVVKLPGGLAPEQGVFLALTGVAYNAVLDGQLLLGESVAVFGAGVIGLLIVQLCRLAGAAGVFVVDPIESRRDLARRFGATHVFDPASGEDAGLAIRRLTEGRGADLAVEVSGAYAGLHEAVRSVGYNGRVVVSGFLAGAGETLRLGEEFHHNRVRLISSQSFGVLPDLSDRWDPARRTLAALDLLPKLDLAPMITHRFKFAEAAKAFELVDTRPEDVLQVVLEYE